MADLAKTLLAINRGDFDDNLGDIGDALTQRQSDLVAFRVAATALAGYGELTGITVPEVLKLLADEE